MQSRDREERAESTAHSRKGETEDDNTRDKERANKRSPEKIK